MFSPDFLSLDVFSLLAADQTILTGLPTVFGVSTAWFLPLVLAIIAMVVGVMYGKSIRMEDHGWRVGLIGAAFLASLTIVLFWPYKLGVDLKGGAILVYAVDKAATAANHPQGKLENIDMQGLLQVLKKRLNPDGLKEIVIRPFGPEHIEIVVPEVDDAEVEAIKKRIETAGNLRFLILADSETRDRLLIDAAKAQAEATTQKERMDRNVHDPASPDKIIGFWADIRRQPNPGGEYADFAETLAVTKGQLLRDGSDGRIIDIPPAARGEFQANPALYFHRRQIKDVQVLMVVDPDIDMRGNDLAAANESMNEQGPFISFQTKGESSWKMSQLTRENRPSGNTVRHLGIVWDGVLESAPSIQSEIGERGQITGSFTQKEVREKVELLRSGSMPVVMESEPTSDDRIGATLGAETVRSGSQAIVISLLIVLGFILFYYRIAGFIACFALVLNMLLTVAIMFAFKAPFTLPGLAGLVLTVGMSVDANVLIYERIREELEKGAALRMAIRNGFDKALVTIIDSNVTTLLTAIILYVIGTDQVRGFGLTLIFGILTSMFTAIFVSRTILEIGEKAYRWQTMSMLKFFTHMNVDWMKSFRPAAVVSVILIAVGLVATVSRGMGIFDIDIAGGTTVQFELDEQKYPSITEAEVRKKMADAFEGVIEEKTKAKAEFNIYQNFINVKDATGKTTREMVWKVDSSLQDAKKLEEIIQNAFKKDGKEGLQTYEVSLGEVKVEESKAPAVTPPASDTPTGPAVPPKLEAPEVPPKTDEPKTDAPKTDEPKADAPKGDAPAKEEAKPEEKKADETKPDDKKADDKKADDKKADDKKADDKKADDKKADDKKADDKDSSDCQPGDEAKQPEEKKADDKQLEAKTGDEPKTEPAKTEPADPTKTDPPKTETPAADPAKTDPPAAENDPTKVDPIVPPVAPATAPASPASTQLSTVELKLSNGKLGGNALLEMISAAANKTIGRNIAADVSSPGWSGESNKAYSNWTISLPLPKEDAEKVLAQLQQDLSQEVVWQSSSTIGGQVATDTRYRAIGAIVGSIFVMIVYMWIRFHKISWGIAAAVALAHDALVMLGALAVSYWLAGPLGFLMVEEFKISLPVVAAFLTLIGYSVNDTIVIFDRIREIRGKSPQINGQMVNDAVNQTLSRTFLTAGTTLMVILILYFLGGSGIHAFAFALVIGVISGSYSTVFIASPLLIYLIGLDQEGAKKKNVPAVTSSTTRGAA